MAAKETVSICVGKPSVSVIVTVYNGEEYLTECLESILSQTLKNIEIICVDDASTDETPRLLERFGDRLIILTNAKNCMAGESRNRGLRAATGEYVIFLDADDVFESSMLERAYNRAKSCRADICIFKEDFFTENIEKCYSCSYAETVMEKLGEKEFFSPLELAGLLFNLWNGWAWDKLFRREFILDAGIEFPDIQTSEDGFFVHAAMASANRISLLNEVLVHHRTGNVGSLSNTRDLAWRSCITYLEKLKQYLEQKKLFDVYERSYVNWAANFLYWNYQTLGSIGRRRLAEAMEQFFVHELNLGQYDNPFFYDAFLWWFTRRIIKQEADQIPLTEEEHFEKLYQLNSNRLNVLYEHIVNNQWSVALWGAGIRGQAFAKLYGKSWIELQYVYDMDKDKQGKDLCFGLTIRDWDRLQSDVAGFILVLNSAHLLSVREHLHGEDVVLFDINTYLTLPYSIDECMLDCQN